LVSVLLLYNILDFALILVLLAALDFPHKLAQSEDDILQQELVGPWLCQYKKKTSPESQSTSPSRLNGCSSGFSLGTLANQTSG